MNNIKTTDAQKLFPDCKYKVVGAIVSTVVVVLGLVWIRKNMIEREKERADRLWFEGLGPPRTLH
jgi:hypothetical protein